MARGLRSSRTSASKSRRGRPANCGWNVDWPRDLLARAEGLPLKNLTVTAGNESVSGELLITRYGIEGGAIYRLGPILRAMAEPIVESGSETATYRRRAPRTTGANRRAGRVGEGVETEPGRDRVSWNPSATPLPPMRNEFIALREKFLARLAESTSDRGSNLIRRRRGLARTGRLAHVKKLPGLFVAGEMIDWEAPTGGYLIAGLFHHRHPRGARRNCVHTRRRDRQSCAHECFRHPRFPRAPWRDGPVRGGPFRRRDRCRSLRRRPRTNPPTRATPDAPKRSRPFTHRRSVERWRPPAFWRSRWS